MSPRFSVITSVFDPEPDHLRECIASVDAQGRHDAVARGGVEHIVVDDASTRTDVQAVLDDIEQSEQSDQSDQSEQSEQSEQSDQLEQSTQGTGVTRRVIRRVTNGGIVAGSNDALAAATGEFVVLLDHDDLLHPDALAIVAAALDVDPDIDVAYSDHDLLRPDGRRAYPLFKPDFSLERLRHHNYITHLVVARRSIVERIGGFTVGMDGAQDHDLLLRLAEVAGPFHHIPHVLVHWRQAPTSSAFDSASKPRAIGAEVAAVGAHLERCGIDAQVEATDLPGIVRTLRVVQGRPLVSVVIPTRGSRGRVWGAERIFVHEAVASIVADPDDRVDLEFVVVVDARDESGQDGDIDCDIDAVVERGLRQIAGDAVRIVEDARPFNFAERINAGVEAARGDYVLLLNDDTELIGSGSIAEMVGLAQQPDVGMVGAKLLFDDGTLQHGGHMYHGTITHVMHGWRGDHPGPYGLMRVVRECAGATAAACLMRTDVFRGVGAMNTDFAANYNDVDLSMTVREAGYRILWTPHASWYHFESRSFAHPIDPEETALIEQRWGAALYVDPYANENLTPGRNDWLELPHRSGAPSIAATPSRWRP